MSKTNIIHHTFLSDKRKHIVKNIQFLRSLCWMLQNLKGSPSYPEMQVQDGK